MRCVQQCTNEKSQLQTLHEPETTVTIGTETNCNRRWFEVSTVVVKFKTVVFRLSLRFVSEAVTMDVS